MTKRKLPLSWVPIILFCILGLLLLAFPGYRFSACILFAIAALLVCFRLLRILAKYRPRLALWSRRILLILVCIVLLAAAVTGAVIVRGSLGSTDTSCKYVIVLGAGVNGTEPSLILSERIRCAYKYLSENPDVICIVSGGQGTGEDLSEAQCMFDHLTAMGISADRIWMEDQSTSTRENLRFSLALIRQKAGVCPDTAGIISNEFHLFRAAQVAREQGLQNPVGIPAQTTWLSLRINYYLREIVAVWYYTIFGG